LRRKTNTAPTGQFLDFQNASSTSIFAVDITGQLTAGTIPVARLEAGTRGDVIYYGASGWAKLGFGTNGNQLTTHGSGADPTWDTPGGAAGAAGADKQVQFNDGGTALGADSAFTWNKTTDVLTVLGTIELGNATDTTLSRDSAGVAAVEGVKVLATNSTSGTQQGLIAVNSSSGAVVGTQANASGTSVSGTAGTNIATITAAGGNQFVAINGVCSQVSGANTQLTATITYADSTTTSVTTSVSTGTALFINNAAIAGSSGTFLTANSAKKITAVSCVTANTGNTVRNGALSAIEIPQ
jgi:hypothetical protein